MKHHMPTDPREAANGEIAVRFPELDGADGDAGGHRFRVARLGDNLERSGFPVGRAAKIMSGHGNRAGDDQEGGDAGGGVATEREARYDTEGCSDAAAPFAPGP